MRSFLTYSCWKLTLTGNPRKDISAALHLESTDTAKPVRTDDSALATLGIEKMDTNASGKERHLHGAVRLLGMSPWL